MLLFLVVLASAPKNCGSDKICMLKEVTTCGPAAITKTEAKPGLTVTSTLSIFPKSRDVCRVAVESVASSTGDSADKYNSRPQAHQTCEMEPTELIEFFEGKPKSLRRPAQCWPQSCPAPTAQVESGCSWSTCGDSVIPRLECGAKTCSLRVNNLCTLDGVRATDCSALDLLAYDCVASCPNSGDVVLECRSKKQ